ncbi:MAG: autoinducer 2 ABC transporter substrate-binding protein [Blautia sp.]|nr:autoinducer 2 ABC transporter substrate-binding protein [Blautia sp.]
MKKNVKMLVAGGLVLTMALGGAVSVLAEDSDAGASGGSYTIAMIPKIEGITFFSMAEEGALRAGEELGVNVIYEGPTTPSAKDQVALIKEFVEEGVDAICVSPNDLAEVGAALLEAKEAGITVLDWDSQCGEAVTTASIYNVHDKEFGEHMVDKLVEAMGTEGQYAIVTGGLDAANLNAWIDYGRRYAEVTYPDLELVAIPIPSDEDAEKAYKVTKMILESYPDLKGILGYSTPTAPGCAKAIQELGLQDQVALVANGMEVDCEEYRADGSLDCGCLWDVEKLGYLTIATAKYILDGNELSSDFAVDGIDSLTVSENGHNVFYTEIGNDF